MCESGLTPKAEALYAAVDALMLEGADINRMTVAQIAGRAGIGKGTTYEYFANKEELIAGALLHRISSICREIRKEMKTRKGFQEKICYLLDAIDEMEHEKTFLLKVVNIVTDQSPVSRQIETMLKEYASKMYMPENILDDLLLSAREQAVSPRDVPAEYIKLNVASKLLAYTMFSMLSQEQRECSREVMFRLVCNGICEEAGIPVV